MSKNKARQPEPARSSSGKTTPRAVSASSTSSPKFYDGPTVRRADKSNALVKKETSTALVRATPKKPKRRGGLFSLITFIPILLFFSLFSTVLCPPPSSQPSGFARSALNSLGFSKPQHATLHETLCYPANVYRESVLEPYVYPVLADVQEKVHAHPIYKQKVEPTYNVVKGNVLRVWNGPVKPVVNRIARGARKFYLVNIQPRLPYLRAKFTEATAPLTHRVKALYNQYAAEHVQTVRKHSCAAWKQARSTYRSVAAHPLTAQAGKHSQTAFRLGKEQAHKAYLYSKPHAIKAWDYSAHHAQHTVLPRLVMMFKIACNDVARVFGIIKNETHKLYKAHAAEHVDPYLNTAREAIAPYQAAFDAKVYQPHIKPFVEQVIPPVVETQKSFWAYLAEWAPSESIHVDDRGHHMFNEEKPTEKQKAEAEAKAKAKKPVAEKEPVVEKIVRNVEKIVKPVVEKPKAEETVKPKVEVKTEPVEVKTESVEAETKTASPSPSPSAHSATTDAERLAEANAAIDALKKKVDFQGKAAYGRIQAEIIKVGEHFIELLGEMHNIGMENIDREMKRMITGLDRLYSNSKSLTRGQVAESIQMSDKKVLESVNVARNGVQTKKNQLKDKYAPTISQAQKDLDKLVGAEYEALGKKMSLIDSVSRKEWTAYKSIKKDVEAWKTKFAEAAEKPTTRSLKDLNTNIQTKVNEILTQFNDLHEVFHEQQAQLKKVAVERIAAREAVEKDQREAPVRAGGKAKNAGAADGRVSIQPIKEENNLRGGAPVIGKDKVQVEEALKKAVSVPEAEKAKITRKPEL